MARLSHPRSRSVRVLRGRDHSIERTEHHLALVNFFEYVKEEYREVEAEIGLPLADILRESGPAAPVTHLPPKP